MQQAHWIDDELNGVAADQRRGALPRLVGTTAFGLILAGNLGWRVAVAWTLACVSVIFWGYCVSDPSRPSSTLPDRAIRLAHVVTSSAILTSMPVAYWMSGDVTFQLISSAILLALIVVAANFSFKAKVMVAAFGTLPASAFIILPMTLGGFPNFKFISLSAISCLVILFLIFVVKQNVAHARALRLAQAELAAQKEAADAANQAKTSFLAMMSHELRTPMNGVLGMAHALTLTKLDRRQASHVDMLVRSGKGLMSILNDILDISKIEAGKLELEIIAFDLHEVGQRVHDLWSEAASAKGVRLVFDLSPDTPQWVLGDPTRLRQIMINLVSNALKFTGEGTVELAISPAGGDLCRIRVTDTGLGIPESQRGRLFQSFVQADTSTTRKFGGTGLGLAICKQLTVTMGGDIEVASREGEGSVFTVTVSLPATEAVAPEQTEGPAIDLAGLRVLVADDNAINQAVARAILEAFGADVSVAGDGREALEQLRSESLDIVLMDVHMPLMGGVEAVQLIRKGAAGRADMPVIALTADAMAGVDDALRGQGFDDVAPKPINPAELVAKIVGVLSRSSACEPGILEPVRATP